jgi:hypothetical protein
MGHVAHTEEIRTELLSKTLKKRDHFGDLSLVGSIILRVEWILKKYGVRIRNGFIYESVCTTAPVLFI